MFKGSIPALITPFKNGKVDVDALKHLVDWHVAEGTATVYGKNRKSDQELVGTFGPHKHIHINCEEWHQLCNETNQPLKLIEIQYGNSNIFINIFILELFNFNLRPLLFYFYNMQ